MKDKDKVKWSGDASPSGQSHSRTIAEHCGISSLLAIVFLFIFISVNMAYATETYTVRKGDSLYKIAKRFHVTVDELMQMNEIDDNRLKIGMRLKIPSAKDKVDNKSRRKVEPLETVKGMESRTEKASFRQKKETADLSGKDAEFHIVKKGDTLSSISKRYGVSISELKEINELSSKRLKIGQKILLKKRGPRTYTVKKGDNIWRIARKYNLDVEELMELNELDSEELRPGQKLLLEAWIDEKDLKRYETSISEGPDSILKGNRLSGDAEEVRIADPDLVKVGLKDRLILFAKKMMNIPYKFGGSSFMGIDCSGYVQKVFGLLNIPLPRTAREQFELGKPVDRNELNIGDLVFFRTYASFPSHVGIYLGNNLFIHASSKSRKVTIDSLDTPYYFKRFIGAKRIITEEGQSYEAER